MRPVCPLKRRVSPLCQLAWPQRRNLVTIAIETSCDDTSVAVLEKHHQKSQLHFHSKITADNRVHRGVHPLVAHESHQKNVAKLINTAVQYLPIQQSEVAQLRNTLYVKQGNGDQLRRKPDFVTVTRGPGMFSCLSAGLDTAKGLAVAWQVPLLGVNHMQAHALTPRLVSSLGASSNASRIDPEFPFVSLLVSGGHTMLVHSRGLCEHRVIAGTSDIAIGDFIDKCARAILPEASLDAGSDIMYGSLLESFAFPNRSEDYNYTAPETPKDEMAIRGTGYDWRLVPPLAKISKTDLAGTMRFSFSGLGSIVDQAMLDKPNMLVSERRALAQETMRVAFEHLASRLLIALKNDPTLRKVNTVVVSGGVASNQFLKYVLR
jgi:N6-L-threonylcarbamoyladenine synthase